MAQFVNVFLDVAFSFLFLFQKLFWFDVRWKHVWLFCIFGSFCFGKKKKLNKAYIFVLVDGHWHKWNVYDNLLNKIVSLAHGDHGQST